MTTPNLDAFESMIHRSLKAPRIVLFGSRWLGNARPNSDVDLVVLSEDFSGWGHYERRKMVEDAKHALGMPHTDCFLKTTAEWARSGWMINTVESQRHEKDWWRRLFEEYGRGAVLSVVNARKGSPLRMEDIGAEVAHKMAAAAELKALTIGGDLWGDKLERFFKKWGADKAAQAYSQLTGTDCRCCDRKDFLNETNAWVRDRLKDARERIFGGAP